MGKKQLRQPARTPLLPQDIEEKFVKGSGAGGQKINKVKSCVQLLHTPSGIHVACQKFRSLTENRKRARTMLQEKLDLLQHGADSKAGRKIIKAQKKKANKRRRGRLKEAHKNIKDNEHAADEYQFQFKASELVGGTAEPSKLLSTSVGLSFWGGVDPLTSTVVDHTHPLFGVDLRNTILAVPNGRGSCTGSQVMLELLLNGIAPRPMLLRQPDAILALGVIVAEEMFNVSIPILDLGPENFDLLLTNQSDDKDVYAAVHGSIVLTSSSEVHVQNSLDDLLSSPHQPPSTADHLVQVSALSLNTEESDALHGDDAMAVAMRILTRAAAVDGATSLLPITQAHIDGCTYIGPGGLRFAQRLAELGGQVSVPTTLNSNSVDRRQWESLGVPSSLGVPAHALGDAYLEMGCSDRSFTCAPYLLESQPGLGEQIAWGESNAVVYANSILGSRTEKVADYLDICCAIVGKAPKAGVHLDENRLGQVVLDVRELSKELLSSSCNINTQSTGTVEGEDAFYPLLGYLCGMKSESESSIPVIVGLEERNDVTKDCLKAFSAAFGSTAAVPMFHMVGHTPEAPDLNTALGNIAPLNEIILQHNDLMVAWQCLDSGTQLLKSQNSNGAIGNNVQKNPPIQLVAVGNPHLSLTECETLANLCDNSGGHVGKDVKMIATLGREIYSKAVEEGHVERMKKFGVEFINDTCWCMLSEPVVPTEGDALITNSAKYAHYAPGLVGKRVHFHSLSGCVEAAKSGTVPPMPKWMYRGFKSIIRRRF